MSRVLVAHHGIIPLEEKEEQWYVGLSDIWDYRAAIDLNLLHVHQEPTSRERAEEIQQQISRRAIELKQEG